MPAENRRENRQMNYAKYYVSFDSERQEGEFRAQKVKLGKSLRRLSGRLESLSPNSMAGESGAETMTQKDLADLSVLYRDAIQKLQELYSAEQNKVHRMAGSGEMKAVQNGEPTAAEVRLGNAMAQNKMLAGILKGQLVTIEDAMKNNRLLSQAELLGNTEPGMSVLADYLGVPVTSAAAIQAFAETAAHSHDGTSAVSVNVKKMNLQKNLADLQILEYIYGNPDGGKNRELKDIRVITKSMADKLRNLNGDVIRLMLPGEKDVENMALRVEKLQNKIREDALEYAKGYVKGYLIPGRVKIVGDNEMNMLIANGGMKTGRIAYMNHVSRVNFQMNQLVALQEQYQKKNPADGKLTPYDKMIELKKDAYLGYGILTLSEKDRKDFRDTYCTALGRKNMDDESLFLRAVAAQLMIAKISLAFPVNAAREDKAFLSSIKNIKTDNPMKNLDELVGSKEFSGAVNECKTAFLRFSEMKGETGVAFPERNVLKMVAKKYAENVNRKTLQTPAKNVKKKPVIGMA